MSNFNKQVAADHRGEQVRPERGEEDRGIPGGHLAPRRRPALVARPRHTGELRRVER